MKDFRMLFIPVIVFFLSVILMTGCASRTDGSPSPLPAGSPGEPRPVATGPLPVPSTSPVILPGKAVVDFTVRDSRTGKPLEGVEIAIIKKTAVTDKNGICRMEISPGTYDVALNHKTSKTVEQITAESFVDGPQARQYDFELP